jgi:hypothetical protein
MPVTNHAGIRSAPIIEPQLVFEDRHTGKAFFCRSMPTVVPAVSRLTALTLFAMFLSMVDIVSGMTRLVITITRNAPFIPMLP